MRYDAGPESGDLPHELLSKLEYQSRLRTLFHTDNVALMMRPENHAPQQRFEPE